MPISARHTPVLLAEVMEILHPSPHESLLDVTLGLGGHAKEILLRTGPDGTLTGIDDDSDNLRMAKDALSPFGDRTILLHANFGHLEAMALPAFDMILADLGLSSPHIDIAERGFSFREDASLDMRYDRTHGATAAQFIRDADERTLAVILSKYGEIPRALHLSKVLKSRLLSTTFQLRDCVQEVFRYKTAVFLPQVFQALRMAVNSEVKSLESLLACAPRLLKPGGRLAILSYHSLEDRLVKDTFRSLCTPVIDERTGAVAVESPFRLLTKKCIVPSEREISENPRARSAKLRAILKTPSL